MGVSRRRREWARGDGSGQEERGVGKRRGEWAEGKCEGSLLNSLFYRIM